MFIKIACNKDKSSWRWYDADQVQTSKDTFWNWVKLNCGCEDLENIEDFTTINEELLTEYEEPDKETEIMLVTFVSPDGTPNNIYTDMTVFLLNNNGETIEKLN